DYAIRKAILFDVRTICGRDIECSDVDLSLVEEGMAVLFSTGFLSEKGYGTKEYIKEHPELSPSLIDALLEKKVSLIIIDATGIRRGKDHTPADQKCADHGAFVIENAANLETLPRDRKIFELYTFPSAFVGFSGVPVRLVAKIEDVL
ncbi:MAG: cyclase family protein, partial [Spirochaetales bacterium]|nr:cyclase family protein [Candidatus Physcosoma equi]